MVSEEEVNIPQHEHISRSQWDCKESVNDLTAERIIAGEIEGGNCSHAN